MNEVPLREYVEAVLNEQRRGVLLAEQEREKAAKALRIELARAIEDGDRALRDHIEQQIMQIRAALVSAEALELERIEAVSSLNMAGHAQIGLRISAVAAAAEQHVEQLRRERELVTGGQMEAIAKAESATEKRFESVNEFRAQLAEQTNTFLPREVADAQLAELRKGITEVATRLDRMEGSRTGSNERREQQRLSTAATVAVIGVAVTILGLIVVIANMAFGGS